MSVLGAGAAGRAGVLRVHVLASAATITAATNVPLALVGSLMGWETVSLLVAVVSDDQPGLNGVLLIS